MVLALLAARERRALDDLLRNRSPRGRLGDVHDDHQRFPGEQPELSQHRLLFEIERHRAHRFPLVEMLLDATQERDHLGLLLLLQARGLLGALYTLRDGFEVGELQLEL